MKLRGPSYAHSNECVDGRYRIEVLDAYSPYPETTSEATPILPILRRHRYENKNFWSTS